MNIYFINWQADYEMKMIKYLKENFSVFDIYVPHRYLWVNKKIKKTGISTEWLARLFIKKHLYELNDNDVVIFNDSLLNKGINQEIINSLRCKKVLLLRNSVDEAFIKKYYDFFDLIYNFESNKLFDSKVRFLDQFFPIGFKDAQGLFEKSIYHENPVCFFLGQDKGRIKSISLLAERLAKYNCNVNFNVIKDRNSSAESDFYTEKMLSYEDNIKHSLAADILIDITKDNQSGWTLRILEALFFNKKIITNNLSVMNADIYSKERFFILEHDRWDDFNLFVQAVNEPIKEDVLYKYSPDFMIEKIRHDLQEVTSY